MLEIYRLFLKRIGLVGVTNFLVALNTIILIPILTKTVGATDYGIWVQVMTTFFLVTSVANLGFPFTMLRFLSTETDKKKIQESFYSMLSLILIVSFIISSILLLFSKEIAVILFNGNILIVYLLGPLLIFGSANGFLIDYFVTFSQTKKYSFFLLFQTYFSLLLISYFAFLWKSISLIVLGFLIAQIILLFLMMFFIIRDIDFRIPNFSYITEYLHFSLPTIPSNLSNWIVESSDRYVIGIVLGTTFVAYYSPGYTLGMVILLFSAPLSVILPSILPKYYENGQISEVMKFINYSMKYFLLIAIPMVFGLSILSKPIMMILTTPEIALNGYLVTPFVALSSLLLGVYGIIANLIILEKKTKIIGGIWTIAALISLLNLIFVPYFGILAAAAITLISYLFAFVFSFYYVSKSFKIPFDYIFLIKTFVASFFVSAMIFLVNPEGILGIVLIIGISIVIYLLLIIVMGAISKNEIKFFKNFFINK
ncbi:lipopolysaccharide biosynthesis protein [Methanobacterium formicicum]|uniref:Lipopolysaccharide biosynthesis protein n=1 Tax=Methanobacterium formicicum TaxID=2162 RepID=A0A843AUF5_METFO|nr:lipopolysaccharide biosynthesis protein [Methanobacterium formicicum]MBF4474375.1 lipopolysaccharide biosynthesis protein [Methanobacterium formicicum]